MAWRLVFGCGSHYELQRILNIFAGHNPFYCHKQKYMKTSEKYRVLLLMGMVLLAATPAHAQFVTLARKIKSMHSTKADVATVLIDARPYRVYKAVTDTLTHNKKFVISNIDNAQRQVEFTRGKADVTLKVDSLADGLSQITVSAAHVDDAEKQTTDYAVEAILAVCSKIGIKCTVDKPKSGTKE
jgi:hypothetical protein